MEHIIKFGLNMPSVEEYNQRRELFSEMDSFIAAHNETNASFTLGHNQFSHMTEGEKARTRGLLNPEYLMAGEPKVFSEDSLPSSVDWRTANAVNPIQDQGHCGSCWAFSTMAAVEGAHAIATGELLKFSEQQLVDCSTLNNGCNGGSMALAFLYLESHYAELESVYPYKGVDGTCAYNSKSKTAVETTGYTNVTARSSSQMMASIATGVVSVAIEADQAVFQMYSSGVFDSAQCGTNLDHGVTLVGYGSENGQDYYILRNSWGTTWGDQGYMKIANTGSGAGICGVQLAGVFPQSN
jgi:C1A family cysteine protease